jgi:hypothetical protein
MPDLSQSILKLNKKTIDFKFIIWEFYIRISTGIKMTEGPERKIPIQ